MFIGRIFLRNVSTEVSSPIQEAFIPPRKPILNVILFFFLQNTSGMDTTPQAIFTSFKLPKPNTNGSERSYPDSGNDRLSMSPLPLLLHKRTSESPKPLSLCQPTLVVSFVFLFGHVVSSFLHQKHI